MTMKRMGKMMNVLIQMMSLRHCHWWTMEPLVMIFVYQSNSMKRLYQRYGKHLVLLDATYKTTKYALPLYFLVVQTNVNYQVRWS